MFSLAGNCSFNLHAPRFCQRIYAKKEIPVHYIEAPIAAGKRVRADRMGYNRGGRPPSVEGSVDVDAQVARLSGQADYTSTARYTRGASPTDDDTAHAQFMMSER